LFLRYVIDQFGEETLTRLIRNSEPGVKNLETATGVPFEDLFRGWTIALAQGVAHSKDEANAGGQFRSIRLTDRLGRWSLQGPKVSDWHLGTERQSFSLLGTTAKIIDIRAATPGVYRLRVRTTGRPNLQVTVIWQDAEAAPTQASADWQFPVSLPAAASPVIHARIPADRTIVRVSVECEGRQSQSHFWEADQLPALEIPSAAGATLREYVLSPPERMFPREGESPLRWQLKILFEDNLHRPSAQWIDLPRPTPPAAGGSPPLAHRPGTSVL
jgi:hypothetical protein